MPSGGHNRVGSAGLGLESSVEVERWPWEDDWAHDWTQQAIFAHIAEQFEAWGVTKDKAAGDATQSIADAHWLRMKAVKAIEFNGDDAKIGKQDAVAIIPRMNARILGGYRLLGLYPYATVRVVDGEDDEDDMDFC